MVLTLDKNTNKLSVTLNNNDGAEIYECTLTFCRNPTCTCGIITLDLVPAQDKDDTGECDPFRVDIDIYNKKLEDDNKKKARQKDLQFARRFVEQLGVDDFKILYDIYYSHKNKITEERTPAEIDVNFVYEEVEEESLMLAYNDVLPYGDNLTFTLNGTQCIILDQHCLKPNCSCTETILNMFSVDEHGENGNELCVFSVDYKKKKWETVEISSSDVNIKTLKSDVEQQIPDIYSKLKQRHLRLKAVYAYNKKRHYTPKQKLQIPKVGRNDPCPCGSGKKYKKCCLV